MLLEFTIIFILLFIIFGLVYQFMFDIWIEVLIISVVFFITYVTLKIIYHHKHKEQTIEPVETNSFVQQKPEDPSMKILKPFISKNINQGFKPQIIKNALMKQGWPKEKIEQGFKELNL